jgi:membrane protease YdiL (CAAX protease family)
MNKKKWILIMAGLSTCLFLIFYLILGSNSGSGKFTNFSDFPLGGFILGALFLGPVVEEIFFRGFFADNKYLKGVAYMGMIFLLFLNISTYLIIVLTIFFLVLFSFFNLKGSQKFLNLAMILNSLIFSLYHYDLDSFFDVTNYYILLHFSIGLFLTWITINYNIFKGIVIHFIWNAIVISFILFSLQTPDEYMQNFENDLLHVEWKRTPRFDQRNITVKFESEGIMATHVEARELYKMTNINKHQKSKTRILQSEPFMRYNFKIFIKDTTVSQEKMMKYAKAFLLESGLVYIETEPNDDI